MRKIEKPVDWHPAAKKALQELPASVRAEFGHELYLLQIGETPGNASPFEGSVGTDIMKLVERFDGDTYRCVYAAKLETAIYVLHVYMKKSNEGKLTPQHIIDTVHGRYRLAKQLDLNARVAEQRIEKHTRGQ